MRKLGKKGQLGGLEEAPAIVMIIGLVFLTMATVALIGDKYGASMLEYNAGSVVNETGGFVNETGYTLAQSSTLGFSSPSITAVYDASDDSLIVPANYTLIGNKLYNATSDTFADVLVSYNYNYYPETTAYNATGTLQSEISNNTSIAGIVLTISLIGIVLTILMGVFMGVTRRTNRI